MTGLLFVLKNARKEAILYPEKDWREGFLFLANDVALDFVNTLPGLAGQPIELLGDYALLVKWFRASGLISPAQAARLFTSGSPQEQRETLANMIVLRETLRAEVLRIEAEKPIRTTTLDTLNDLMARHPMLRRLVPATAPDRALEDWFAPEFPRDLFAPIALAAATMFTTVNPLKLKKCETCALHFVDTSRNSARRWCSMRMCGNRAKVAAFSERQRTGVY